MDLTAVLAAKRIPFLNSPAKPGIWWDPSIMSWENTRSRCGGELRRHRIGFLQAGAPNGLFAFTNSGTASGTYGVGGDALAGLMIGYVDNAFTEYEIPPFTTTQNYQMGGFVQDNWRVSTRLTLNIGFRYDVETPRTERYNQMSYFDPSAPVADLGSWIESPRRRRVRGCKRKSEDRVQHLLGRGWTKVRLGLSDPQPHDAARRLRNLLRSLRCGRRRQCSLRRFSRLRCGDYGGQQRTFSALASPGISAQSISVWNPNRGG